MHMTARKILQKAASRRTVSVLAHKKFGRSNFAKYSSSLRKKPRNPDVDVNFSKSQVSNITIQKEFVVTG